MKLAVSNIAWTAAEDQAVEAVLREEGVEGIEIAPTRVFADPGSVSAASARERSERYADEGLEVVAFQSILFERPQLTIFDDPEARGATARHLEMQIRLAAAMGAGRLVLGSPRNRRVPESMSAEESLEIATSFFTALGVLAEQHATVLCIEPNPAAYGCNFVTTSQEGADLVTAVDSPGFGLHLDAAGMTLSGEDLSTSIRSCFGSVRHFHASAPHLDELEDDVVDHDAAATALQESRYAHWVSIEMRAGAPGTNVNRVRRAIRIARRHYLRDGT